MSKKWFLALSAFSLLSFHALGDGELRKQMITHVEKIIVVDTLNVDRDSFLDAYRLQPSSGALLYGREVEDLLGDVSFPEEFVDEPLTGFTNEFRDYLIWAQPDTTDMIRLAESVRLGDGSWSAPKFTPLAGEAEFPFMDSDGQSLYFASDTENTLGGLDIFISYRDPADGSYSNPRNLGMPFNSEFDDYMMVLDNQTGVGWWASERNQLEDEVTIYIYVLSDTRTNVDPADENIEAYASLSGWETLLDEDAQAARQRFLDEIAAISPVQATSPDFYLPMGGKVYRYFSDFTNTRAASLMKSYLEDKEALEEKERELATLRNDYYLSAGGRRFADRIQLLEEEVRQGHYELKNLLSDIYRYEQTSTTNRHKR